MKTRKIILWSALFLTAAAALAMVAVPVFLIKPFSPQMPGDLAVSFALKGRAPAATVILSAAALVLAFYLWRLTRWYGKVFLVVPLAALAISVWFARQNHFEWMFNPLADSSYSRADEANFVAGDEMVLAVTAGGESVAYPVRLIAYHHIVNDTVGGVPLVATY